MSRETSTSYGSEVNLARLERECKEISVNPCKLDFDLP